MARVNLWNILTDLPKLIVGQILHFLRRALRGPMPNPDTQSELAELVNRTRKHEIRAGYAHRFITLMFVTVGDRVFCRRYTYGEPSWYSAFRADPASQIRLDGTVANIDARVPGDLDDIIPDVDRAYADSLRKLAASFMLAGATEPRAQASAIEITLTKDRPRPADTAAQIES